MPLFCRHNRYVSECPICSKGTVLDPNRGKGTARRAAAPSRSTAGARRAERPSRPHGAGGGARLTIGPHSSAGPYEHDDGTPFQVRLERVPGGLRLGSWSRAALERRAPVLPGFDLPALIREACEREVVTGRDAERLLAAVAGEGSEDAPVGAYGASAGRSGELREELRVERLADEHVRIARWLYRPGTGEWELQDAPPMLPAARYAEAIGAAVRANVVALA